MLTKSRKLDDFISEIGTLCCPKEIVICDGSSAEYDRICLEMEKKGTFIALKREGCWYARSDPEDVARVEGRTFICSKKKEDAGPTNNWSEPFEMKQKLKKLFSGCMKGRIMYVVPYCMGPIGSKLAKYGVEFTDSPYVVVNMKIMTRMGKDALAMIEKGEDFVPGVHSVGMPLKEGQKDVSWPCNQEKYIVHFPEEREIWSYGSGYGGNALLGKKCLALRIASVIARDEGWLSEHMLILGITNPQGEKRYFAAAFPSACGKTNLAMMMPSLPGWKVECVGDDIAWMQFGEDGRLYAINPENGFFGVAPGTNDQTNPNAMKTIEKNTIFTNVALTKDLDVWWEGMSLPPESLTDWKGQEWRKGSTTKAAHPNSRFTAPIDQCPSIDKAYQSLKGVPIDAIIFGGRRASLMPLVMEAHSWAGGVLMGAGQSSEKTAAAKGSVGDLRHDPFAMLPFCGYNMADYFSHWLSLEKPNRQMPKIFSVNWFRKGANGKLLWPGYGENIRVLKWMFERLDKTAKAKKEPPGNLPIELSFEGLNVDKQAQKELLQIDREGFVSYVQDLKEYFKIFGEKFPKNLIDELNRIEKELQ